MEQIQERDRDGLNIVKTKYDKERGEDMGSKIKNPPKTWKEKLKIVGPGLVWAAAAIGSGELIISSKVGAEYGYLFLWAIWIGIFLKYFIQRGILDLTVLSGKPVVELWHKQKFGKLFSIYWLLFFIVTATGVAGLLGLTASITHTILPFASVNVWAALIVLLVIGIAYTQKYKSFEKIMLILCGILLIGALGAVILAQPSPAEIIKWGIPTTIPAALIFLSLLGWGAGSGPDLMIPYSWWVAEKGYHKLKVSSDKPLMENKDKGSIEKIKAWLNVAKIDTMFGYITAGIVASLFMIAGAAILKPRGLVIGGLDVLTKIAEIFTSTYGAWVFIPFLIGAWAAIFSTTLGVFDGGRVAIAHLSRKLAKREMVPTEKIRTNSWYRTTLILFSLVPLIMFYGFQRPVTLVIIAGVVSAISMPLLAFLVYTSLVKQVPKEFRPNKFYLGSLILGIIVYLGFMVQALISLF
jgi:Mn2+/Fe2+ NRAMP family transporter